MQELQALAGLAGEVDGDGDALNSLWTDQGTHDVAPGHENFKVGGCSAGVGRPNGGKGGGVCM